MSVIRIIGIVLLVVGAIVLVLGVHDLVAYNSSSGGRAANKVAGLFGKRTEAAQNLIIQIVIGAGCVAVGFFLYRRG